MVLAPELAEVGMGLADGVAPLGEMPEMEQTILLMGQGRSALKDNHFHRKGAPDPLPTVSGRPRQGEGLCFLGRLGLLCNQDRQGTQCVLKRLAVRHPGALTPCAKPRLCPQPSYGPGILWGETAPHGSAGWETAGNHLAGALQSSGLVPQSGLAPGEGVSQTVSLSAVPTGGHMPLDLVSKSLKTPGIDFYHHKPESWMGTRKTASGVCTASVPPGGKAA